jgi:glycerol-3-phosphate acyltransferase PlsX
MNYIAVDAYGGDNAPNEIINGAIKALEENSSLAVILSGYKDNLFKLLQNFTYDKNRLIIEDANDVVNMHDKPSLALRKKNSSMAVGIGLVKSKKAAAFVTAGNSGAAMALSMFMLGRIKGVTRPAIAALLPALKGNVLLLDVGANVDCKPLNLLEFAIMGGVYVKYMLGIGSPKIGILNNGSEPGKGNQLTIKSYELLSKSRLNFIGNIEGNEIFKDKADIVVCDGFAGNIVLKTSESIPQIIAEFLKEEIKKSFWYKIGFLLAKPAFRLLKTKVDYSEFGGAPLLGVNGACIISHGRSDAVAVKNAILKALKFSKEEINNKIENSIVKCTTLQKYRKVENDES